ncbi:MAG: hypothetical protein ABI990_08145 [Actinomycetota bacterium]
MSRRLGLVLIVLGALAAVPVALAAYPTPYAAQGGQGVMSKDGGLRFVALKSGEDTTVRAVRTSDGSVAMSQPVAGSFGVPMLTSVGPGGGLFRDGSTFVLQSTGYGANTTFQLVRTGDLALGETIALKGTFAFDALSPDGSKMYLIQHTSVNDLQHYVVRAYDIRSHTLLPGKIADKTQKGWVMQGFPVARTTTADGRWAYTLYWNPNGYPFVHALDTVRGIAHCVGLAAPSPSGAVVNYKLAVKGTKLVVRTSGETVYRVIDRQTWKVTKR